MSVLSSLGWGPFFSTQLSEREASLLPGRAIADRGPRLLVQFEDRARLVVVPGRLRDRGEVPVVGDFVLAPPAEEPPIARVLARRTALTRGAAGRATAEQVLAANVDLVLVVQPLDAGVRPRRLERTLAAARASGADAAVLLSKADLVGERDRVREEAAEVAGASPVLLVSAAEPATLEPVRQLLPPGQTGVLVGPSGAGKSTLLNALVGEAVQATAPVRVADGKGCHTTTGRRLLVLPGGGALVDGPGIRELKLWEADVEAAFEDLATLARGCRFADCRHAGEPGCAVEAAVAAGDLGEARLASFRKLAREAQALAARQEAGAARAEKARWRAIHREARRFRKLRGR